MIIMMYIYDLMLRLYPRRFYEAFADEMRGVFRAGLAEKRKAGLLPALRFFLKEAAAIFKGSQVERWRYVRALKPRDAVLYRARLITRCAGLLLALFTLAAAQAPVAPEANPFITVLYGIIAAYFIALRWELMGGLLLTTLALLGGFMMIWTFYIFDALSYISVGALLWLLPHLCCGMMFMAIDRYSGHKFKRR